MRKVTGTRRGASGRAGAGVRGVACRARLLRSNVHVLCARRMTDAAAAAPFDPSDPAIGAQNRSSDGSSFHIQLNQPIHLPLEAKACSLAVTQASIWNTSYNVSASIGNNSFNFAYSSTPYPNTIPDGLYSVQGLNAFVQRQLIANGFAEDSITLTADESTQKIIITLQPGFQVLFNSSSTCRDLCGFNASVIPSVPSGLITAYYGDNTATFNHINQFQIKSNIVNGGIPTNNQADGVIASVPITSAPGSQVNYAPYNPIEIDCDDLRGHNKSLLSFHLLDQSNRAVETNEYYSFVVRINYLMP